MHYADRLHRLAINQTEWSEDPTYAADEAWREPTLDARTLALVRLAALVAVGGEVPSYGSAADAAVDAGASAAEVVDVLIGVLPVIGTARVVAAAPRLAMALGYDTDALEQEHPARTGDPHEARLHHRT
ncbi:Carboxymuconolactone decarboxylase family protein [Nocardioides sp. YR527]|nr:Carboxymuconolactone decarboxylase family protein [Nocardioides sp. YR527]